MLFLVISTLCLIASIGDTLRSTMITVVNSVNNTDHESDDEAEGADTGCYRR